MKLGGDRESAQSPRFRSSSPRLLYISVDLAEVRGSLPLRLEGNPEWMGSTSNGGAGVRIAE